MKYIKNDGTEKVLVSVYMDMQTSKRIAALAKKRDGNLSKVCLELIKKALASQ